MTDLFDIIYSDHPKSAIFFLFFVVVNLILWGWNKKHPNRKGENDALKNHYFSFLLLLESFTLFWLVFL